MKKITYNNFIKELIKHVPELHGIYASHKQDNKEILPHVLMEDIFRYLEKETSHDPPKWIFKLISFLESAIKSSDVKVKEVIGLSFLDNLADYLIKNNKKRILLRSYLTSNLMKELRYIENWKTSFKGSVKISGVSK